MVGYGVNTKYEINVYCINTDGDTLWNQQYNIDSIGVPAVIRSTLDPQKNILVAGYVYINNSAEIRALLLKTDSLGNLKWIRVYKEDSVVFSEYTGLYGDIPVATYDNQYLLLCQDGRDTGVDNFVAIITDSMGFELNRWRNYNPYYEWPGFAIQTSDSGFLFGGYSNRLDTDYSFYSWTMYIKKVNQYGSLLWDTSIGALSTGGYLYTGDASAQDAIEVPDGYVIAGERSDRSNFTYPDDERGWDKCWYGKFNKSDGRLLWEHYLGPDTLDFAHFYGITQTDDGGYALCGVYNYQNNTRQKGFIAKTDSTGDTLWTYTITRHIDSIHYTEQMELHDIYEINGGYLVTGFRFPDWPLEQNPFPYVLTVDTNGCPVYNCEFPTNITQLSGQEGVSLSIYPNPTGGWLFVSASIPNATGEFGLQIYDVGGRLLQTHEHITPNQPYSLSINGFVNGMYFVEVLNGNNVVGRGRFVKE